MAEAVSRKAAHPRKSVSLSGGRADRNLAGEFAWWSLHFSATIPWIRGRSWCDGCVTPKSTRNCTCELTAQLLLRSLRKSRGLQGTGSRCEKGKLVPGKKSLFQCFGYKGNYPIIVLCELASPPRMGLLCNSCWIQKILNIFLCSVMSHQSSGRGVHPSSL